MKLLIPLLVVTVFAASPRRTLAAEDGPVVIRNDFLEVRADRKTGRITVLAKGKTVLSDAWISSGDLVAKDPVTSLSLHFGAQISIAHENGNIDNITLSYIDLPFALVQTNVRNTGKEPLSIHSIPAFHARVAVGRPADQLKIVGTGGLSKPGKRIGSYMWLAAAEPESRNGIVAGWVTTARGSGIVFAERKDKNLEIDAQLEYGHLRIRPDETVRSECFAIGYFDDVRAGLEAWADAVAKQQEIKLPPQPCGYCTWYHAGASNEQAMVKQTEIAAKELAPFGFNFLQIDDGWQDGVSRNGPRKNFTRVRPDGPYPSGMKQTADMVRSHGLTPGIWFMPFSGTWDDPWFKDHQDWFAKRADGTPFDTPWGGTCMDMTNPEARKYLHDCVRQIAHDWGYRFFKMDGLSTGAAVRPQYVNLDYKDDNFGDAVLHDPDKTNIEAFRSGLKLVREAAGPDVFLLGCCAAQNMRSYGGAFGLVDAMRVGPDNGGSNWNSVLTGPRIASRHYHLNGRVWYNDPDVVYVRSSLSLDQARANASWVAITGQLLIVSDDFSKLTRDRLEVLKRVMPAHGRPVRPIDLLDEEIPQMWLVTDSRGGQRRDVIALFNWDDKQPWQVDYPLDRIGLPQAKRFAAFDFWGNRPSPLLEGRLKATLPPASCLILAVRAETDHPQVISTSRHVTQGMVDLLEEKWDGDKKTLSGRSKVVAGDPYEIRVAPAAGTAKWHATGAQAAPGPVTANLSEKEGLTRLLIKTAAGGEIEWSIRFKD
jgi:hypothetical protein